MTVSQFDDFIEIVKIMIRNQTGLCSTNMKNEETKLIQDLRHRILKESR